MQCILIIHKNSCILQNVIILENALKALIPFSCENAKSFRPKNEINQQQYYSTIRIHDTVKTLLLWKQRLMSSLVSYSTQEPRTKRASQMAHHEIVICHRIQHGSHYHQHHHYHHQQQQQQQQQHLVAAIRTRTSPRHYVRHT